MAKAKTFLLLFIFTIIRDRRCAFKKLLSGLEEQTLIRHLDKMS